jgi:23S rRNA-/tRNA-specific pseudouridylate synthase
MIVPIRACRHSSVSIGRHPTERLRQSGKARHGKHAVTRWRVRARYGRLTLVELRLETGRTHQIRVHMCESGFPLVGDQLYPDGGRFNNLTDTQLRKRISMLGRQALHAATLGFTWSSALRCRRIWQVCLNIWSLWLPGLTSVCCQAVIMELPNNA